MSMECTNLCLNENTYIRVYDGPDQNSTLLKEIHGCYETSLTVKGQQNRTMYIHFSPVPHETTLGVCKYSSGVYIV